MKLLITLFVLALFHLTHLSGQGEVFFYEGFEGGSRPSLWVEEIVQGPAENWRYRNGGHNPNDPNNLIPPDQLDLGRNPDRAYSGTYNAYFQKESTNNETTKLITKEIDLEFAIKPELRFWSAQVPWNWGGQDNFDILRIYYRNSFESEWVLIAELLDPLEDWTYHNILLPNPTKTYYVAFEAQTRWGHGVVLDEIEIVETGAVERYVESITITQANTDFVIAGSENNEVLRIQVKVFGNTGDLKMNSVSVASLNTSDSDISAGGVKLFSTSTSSFSTANQVGGTAASFVNGEAVFTGLDHSLPTGDTYFWITYDIDPGAYPGNQVDGLIEAGMIGIDDSFYPAASVSPHGSRTILETVFFDNFEEDKGWTLTGEFQIAIPEGGGGSPGGPNPSSAYNGSRVLGTDLTGLGTHPYKYEPGLVDTSQHYHAISPAVDLYFYKDVSLRFRQWLNVELWDGAYIELSIDGGENWDQVWRNSNFVLDNNWVQKNYDISLLADRKEEVIIRFGLGDTDDFNNYSGWNIDNFIITGEYVIRDMAVTGWIGPVEDCGMGTAETVQVLVENLAAIPAEDPIPVSYSVDGGLTWVHEVISQTIPVGGSLIYSFETRADFSVPGLYQVKARTSYPGDQEPGNDGFEFEILSLPVYSLPYHEGFEGESAEFWRSGGYNSSWEHGEPLGTVINTAYEGNNAWVTKLSGNYNEEENSWVEGPCFDLRGKNFPVFEMMSWWHTGVTGDYASVLYSKDGKETWHLLGAQGEGDEYSWNWYNSPSGWSGESDGWVTSRVMMPPELVGEEDVCFRVSFTSTAGVKDNEGFAFDNILMYNVPPDVGVSSMVHPVSGCVFSEPVEIMVEIENFGLEVIVAGTEVVAGFDIDDTNILMESFLLDVDLPVGSVYIFSFEEEVDLTQYGEYEFTAYTLLDVDIDFYNQGYTNDSVTVSIILSSIPEIDLGRDIYTVLPDTIMLDAYSDVTDYDYLWQDDSTESFFNVHEEGVYHVTLSDHVGCQASDTVKVVRLIADIGVTGLLSPVSSCELGSEEILKVEIENFGTDTLNIDDQFIIVASVNEGEHVAENVILEEILLPGGRITYTFFEKFDLSVTGAYDITVWTELEHDNDLLNDTLAFEIEVHGYPVLDLGPDIDLFATHYEVDAGEEFDSYLWHDGSTGQKFVAGQPGLNNVSVTVTDHNNCPAWDEISITLNVIDIAMDSVLYPVTKCGAPEDAYVSVRIRNTGSVSIDDGSPVFLGYSINSGSEVIEEIVFSGDLEPGDHVDHTFDGILEFEENNWYHFKIFVTMTGDMVDTNDTLEVSVGIFEPPVIDLGPDVTTESPEYVVDAGPGFASYLWHDGSGEQTFTASQAGINNISVTVTDENNCPASDSKQVLILVPDLGVSEVTVPGTSCAGTTETLMVTVSNYGNTSISSSAYIEVAYSINGADPVIEQLGLTSSLEAGSVVYHNFDQEVLFSDAGVYSIKAWTIYASDQLNHNDSSYALVNVHQNPSPDIGNGEDEIFTWSTLILDAGDGYTSYIWQDGSNNRTYTIDQPVENWFHVTVTDINSCMATDSVYVLFPEADLAVVSVFGPGSACESEGPEPVGLEIVNVGEYPVPDGAEIEFHYRINQGAIVSELLELTGEIAPGAGIYYTFSTRAELDGPGTYDIIAWFDYDNDGNPGNNSAVHTTTIYGFPSVDLVPDADTLFASLPTTIDAGSGFASYLWQDGSDYQSLQVTGFGTYWVRVYDEHGCEASDTIVVESPLNTTLVPAGDELIRVYPNPVSEQLFVRVETESVYEKIGVQLINLGGIILYHGELKHTDRLEEDIAVDNLPKGLYILNISIGNSVRTRTILVQ